MKDLKKERDKLAKKVRDKNFEELRQRNKLLTFKLNSLQESSSRYEELLKNAEDVEESTHRASDAGIATLQGKNKDLTKDYYQTLEDLKELKKENIIQERALFTYEIAIKELNREYQQVCKESGLKDPIQPLDLEEGKNEARVHRKVNRMNSADSYDDSKDRFEQDQQKLIKKQQNFEERQKNILEMKALSKALTAQLQKKDKELDQDYLTLILSNAKKEDKKSFHPKNYGKPSNRSRRGDNSSNLHISSQEVSSLRGSNSFSSSVISAPKLNRRTNSNADPFPRINSSTFSRKKMPITPKGVKKKVPRSRKKPSLVSSVIERPKSPETSHYRNNSNPGKLDEYMKMRHSSVGRKSNPGKRSLSRTKKSASINPATERPKKKRLSKVKLKDFITEVNPSNNNPKKTKPPLDDKKPKLRRVNSDKKKNSAQLSKMERINYRISKRKPTGFNPFKPSIGKSSTPTNRLGKDKAKRNPKNFSSPPKKVTRNKYEEIVEVDEEEDATKTPKAPETDLLNKKPEKEKSSIFQFNNNSSGSKDPSKERPSLGNSSPSLNNSKTNPQPKEDEIDEEKRQQFENKIKKRLEELYANKQDRPEKKMLSTIVSDRMNSQSSFNDSINVEKTNLKGSVQLLRQSSDDGPLPSKSIVSLRKSSDDIIDKPEEPNDKDKEPENDLKPKSFNRRDNKNLSVRERIKRAESPMITVTPAVAPPAEEKYPEKEPEPEEKEDPEEPSIEEKMPKKKNSFKFVLEEMNPSDPSSSSEPPHEQDLKDSKKDFVIGQEEGDSGKKTEERSSTSVKKPKKKLPINLSKAKSESLESSRKETGRSSQNNNKLDPKIGLDNVSPLASPQKQFLYDTPNLAPEKEKVTLPRKSLTLEKKKSTEKVEKVKSVRFDDESQKSRSKSPGMSTKDKKPLKQFSAFKKSSLRSQTSINNNLRRSIVGEKGNLNMDGDGDTGTKSRQIKPIFINENDSSLAGGSKGSKFDVRSVMRPPKRKETGRRSAAFTRVGKRNQDVYEPRELVVHESTSMLKTEGSHMLTQPRSEINHPTTLVSVETEILWLRFLFS